MMGAGRLRHRADFSRRNEDARDAMGNPAPATWAPLLTVWANFRETLGREALAAGRMEGSRTGTLRLRNSAAARGITAADRVTLLDATWEVVSPPAHVDEAGAWLELRLEWLA
ncbi:MULTISPECIES: head-tail adaptor protein [unclassified Sulfitobacter]|uniref:head-tail adaptor protein n=1 Tax=unclassified Sulfitobacter TaxID=196795 RepID=UPI0023E17E34|nr:MULTISPECIES: head-tail adaptor protein [unclassified Sulfitobacter]MDF3383360.1 head-tail adaptor protein [Sulfitobacter sp. Ks11]MDF3386779.1 head-tail adaptor protein [Sulfitobacter sp. M85]MDF3390198.1 head-tail adaptor protein [Sulfitobacter sp. Ks16]MDF3400835.1 head-tail adaptor protein [Sulfitobacter sp. KE39]MDF3404256.1 head-tail adaptor protein [Sulfitobacter sp. Ks35]